MLRRMGLELPPRTVEAPFTFIISAHPTSCGRSYAISPMAFLCFVHNLSISCVSSEKTSLGSS